MLLGLQESPPFWTAGLKSPDQLYMLGWTKLH